MKAVIWTRYGPPEVLQMRDIPKPEPRNNEVLVRIHTATVNMGDCEMRRFQSSPEFWLLARMMLGLFRPRKNSILGQEFAGVVESAGKDVSHFKNGDEIFGCTEFNFGTYLEYRCFPEGGMISKKPANMTFEEAATIPVGGINALHFLRKIGELKGKKILIVGAGGSIGTIAIQMAKYFGARVTAVDSSDKLDMMLSVGADEVIDYTKEDPYKGQARFDVIFDIVGKSPYSRCVGLLRKKGIYLLANTDLVGRIRKIITNLTTDRKVVTDIAKYDKKDLEYLKELIEKGKIRPVIDRRYPLEQIVEAHRYVESGKKIGNVVVNLVPL